MIDGTFEYKNMTGNDDLRKCVRVLIIRTIKMTNEHFIHNLLHYLNHLSQTTKVFVTLRYQLFIVTIE
jgi:chorismate mutase